MSNTVTESEGEDKEQRNILLLCNSIYLPRGTLGTEGKRIKLHISKVPADLSTDIVINNTASCEMVTVEKQAPDCRGG